MNDMNGLYQYYIMVISFFPQLIGMGYTSVTILSILFLLLWIDE